MSSHEAMSQMMGIDKNNEIFNLWYELTYLRMIVGIIAERSDTLPITKDEISKCRERAQELVRKRFPKCEIGFTSPSEK